MFRKATLYGLLVLGSFTFAALPAAAQIEPGTSEVHVYVGQLFGDDLTDRALSGSTPKLDDKIVYGLRYGYNFNESWGIEGSLGRSSNKATHLAGNDVDLDVTTLDVDAVWHFTPHSPVVGYLVAGGGYATASLDHRLNGVENGQPVSIGDDSGFTANAGIGAKYFPTKNVIVRVEGRYRYMQKLVDRFDHSLNTFEGTVGIGWAF